MATLQQQVQQHLQNTGISLRELSRRSGVSHTTISKILRGGTYKSDTAHALYSLISITPISEYVTLHDKVEAIAADRVDCDKGAWDVDLNCAKYRRVMQLEKELEQSKAEVEVWRDKVSLERWNTQDLQNRLSDSTDVLAQREQHLKSCENALIEAHEKITKQDAWIEQEDGARNILQSNLRDANAEIKRLTALSETHGQSWKAACVQVEQLQKQLDHSNQKINELYAGYSQQVDDEREMLAQIDALLTERDNMRTEYEYSLMRLRVRCFALVCAIVFLIVSGLVLWGAV